MSIQRCCRNVSDKCLYRQIKLPIDAQTHVGVLQLLKGVPAISSSSAKDDDVNSHRAAFLRAESPPLQPIRLCSPPIFSRSLQTGYRPSTTTTSKHSLAPEAIADLPELVPKAVMKPDDDEDDLYKQHMVVVNGWRKSRLC